MGHLDERRERPAQTIKFAKGSVLNAILTTALADEVVTIHASHGVKTPPAPSKPRLIITPGQFDRLYQALPDNDARLLVETDIESGMRWGELAEIRVRDLDFDTRLLTISRAVVELTQDDHPDGGRLLVKAYPKDKEYRRFKLSQQIITKIQAHVIAEGLGSDDLIFTYRPPTQAGTRRPDTSASSPAEMTEPNEKGRHAATAHSPPTTPRNAAASTAAAPTPTTGPGAAPAGKTIPGHRERATPTGTSPLTRSVIRYGTEPVRQLGWTKSRFMT